MTPQPSQAPRGLVGRLLLGTAAVMAGLAAAFWFRWLTIGEESRPVIAGVMLLAAIGDAMIALRFLGERD